MNENSLICKILHKLIYKKLFALGLTIFCGASEEAPFPYRSQSGSARPWTPDTSPIRAKVMTMDEPP